MGARNVRNIFVNFVLITFFWLIWPFDMGDPSVELRYAYAVASALHGVRHILRKDFMLQVLMIHDEPFFLSQWSSATVWNLTSISVCYQPPWDLEVGKKFIIHYTYGCDYNLKVQPHKDHSDSNLLLLKSTLYVVICLPFKMKFCLSGHILYHKFFTLSWHYREN